jgi:acetyl esterase/lipase
VKELIDIPFSSTHADRRRVDVFLPDVKLTGAAVLFIHGGGFSGGDKKQWHSVARHFCGLGYVCASVEYRLTPQWPFPAQVEDVRLGMAWFRRQARDFGFGEARVAAAGSSAGGYLALMLATIAPDDPLGRIDELAAPDPAAFDTRPNAVIAYCPVISVHEARQDAALKPLFQAFLPTPESQAPELYRRASTEDRITGRECPILLIHGDADKTVPLADSGDLSRIIQAKGGRAELQVIAGAAHGFGYGVSTGHQQKAIGHFQRFLSQNL